MFSFLNIKRWRMQLVVYPGGIIAFGELPRERCSNAQKTTGCSPRERGAVVKMKRRIYHVGNLFYQKKKALCEPVIRPYTCLVNIYPLITMYVGFSAKLFARYIRIIRKTVTLHPNAALRFISVRG